MLELIKSILRALFGSAPTAPRRRSFDDDYNVAMKNLRRHIDAKYSDNYQARFDPKADRSEDHGERRAAAIDTASAAVAKALREDATVQQAMAAGARSIGLL